MLFRSGASDASHDDQGCQAGASPRSVLLSSLVQREQAQARTNFSQDRCTRYSPSKWPIVGALPAQYLGRGPGPLPINRTSHPQGRGIWILTKKPVDRATELLLAVHRISQEQTPARLFFLVLFIISPRGNPPHHTLE